MTISADWSEMQDSAAMQVKILEKTVSVLLLAYPTLMLTVKGGMNGVLLFMVLLAIGVWLIRPAELEEFKWQRRWTVYVLAMFSMSVAIGISQISNHSLAAHPHDAASRYWLGIPVLLLLIRLRPNVVSIVQIGFPLAAIAGFVLPQEVDSWGRSGLGTMDLVHFGDFEMILGVLSLFSLDWQGRDSLPLRLLKLLGFVAGVWASIDSGTRGGWLAIPIFIVIFAYFNRNVLSLRVVASCVSAVIISAVLLYSFNTTVHKRVDVLLTDVALYQQGERDTSIGIRWQLYGAAMDVFSRHPLVGAGPEGFALEMQPMVEAGKLTSFAGELGRGEVHNDILSKTAGMGVLGLVSILSIYLVPFALFWRVATTASGARERSAILGITFVSGFMVFGLTVEILNLTMATAFYSFTVAVLLAASYNLHSDE